MVCLLSLRASWSSNLHLAKTGCLAFLITLASNLSAQTKPEPPGPDFSKIFRKTDAMVPMRDGVHLHTEIYVPKKMSQPLPFIFERTPYGLEDDKKGFSSYLKSFDDLIKEGYIFVFQDIRGRYKSEGQFVMGRPPRDHRNPRAIDESTDTYDTIP